MFGPGIGAPEILIVVGVIVLLFGGRKLPELARGSGRALRIFKSEVKGLKDDDDDTKPEALETTEAEKKPEQG
ncbi:MAG: Sec-independent protein translocase subunit TatA [Aeromicrobium sp.]|jgi:sec-independent protein translocase protein TatA